MKKKESDELIDKLIAGKISKEGFQKILDSIEDPEEAQYIENSLKSVFLSHLTGKEAKKQSKAKDGGLG